MSKNLYDYLTETTLKAKFGKEASSTPKSEPTPQQMRVALEKFMIERQALAFAR